MTTAIVMLKVEREKINDVGDELSMMKGITEVYSITGEFDLAAIIRVKDSDELAQLVTEKMLKVKGITRSDTHVAFRVYSKHDLETMFEVGSEPGK